MSQKKEVQSNIANWISALKKVPPGNRHKTIREQSKLHHTQLQSIKALCRHHQDLSSSEKNEAAKNIEKWIESPPSIEYHRASIELAIHLLGVEDKCLKNHIQKQISIISWENKDNLDYLRYFTIHKREDPMDLYWLCVIGSKDQRNAIGESITHMTLAHPWLRLLRSLVGLIENGLASELYGPLVYLCFETPSPSHMSDGESVGWSIPTAIKIRRRLTRISGNKEALLLSLLENMPAYPLVPPFPIAKRMMGIGVYEEPSCETKTQKGNENVLWSICEKEADCKGLYIPKTAPFSPELFEQCIRVLRGNAHPFFAFYAARYLLQDPEALKKVHDWEELVSRYPELLPAALSIWMQKPSKKQKSIIENNLFSLGKQGAGALLIAEQWISKHGGSQSELCKGSFSVDAFYDIGTLSILTQLTDATTVAEGIVRRMIWSNISAEAKWEPRWLKYLEGIHISPPILISLFANVAENYQSRAIDASINCPYLISLLSSWKSDPIPELALHTAKIVQSLDSSELMDALENWLIQLIPSPRDDERTKYLSWMTIFAPECRDTPLVMPKLQKKISTYKKERNTYFSLAKLRCTGSDSISHKKRDLWYEESLKMAIRYGVHEPESLEYSEQMWKEELISGRFSALPAFMSSAEDQQKSEILQCVLESYPEEIAKIRNIIQEFTPTPEQIERIFLSLPPYTNNFLYDWNTIDEHPSPSLAFAHRMIQGNAPKTATRAIQQILTRREQPALLCYLLSKAIDANAILDILGHNWSLSIAEENVKYLAHSVGHFFVSKIPLLVRTKRIDTYFFREVLNHIDKKILGQSYILTELYEQYRHMKRVIFSAALFAENESFYEHIAADMKRCIEQEYWPDIEYIVGKNALLDRFFRENRDLEEKIRSITLSDTDSPLFSFRISYELQRELTNQEILNLLSNQQYVSSILQAYYANQSEEAANIVFMALQQNIDSYILESIIEESLPYLRSFSSQEESLVFQYWNSPDQHFSKLIDLMMLCSNPWKDSTRSQRIFSFIKENSRWDTVVHINPNIEYWYRLVYEDISQNEYDSWSLHNILEPLLQQAQLGDTHSFWVEIWSKDPEFSANFIKALTKDVSVYESTLKCIQNILAGTSIENCMAHPDALYSILFLDDESISRNIKALWMERFLNTRKNSLTLLIELFERIVQHEINTDIFSTDWGWSPEAIEKIKELFTTNPEDIYPKIPNLIETNNQEYLLDFSSPNEVWNYRSILYPLFSRSTDTFVSVWQDIFNSDRNNQKLEIFIQEYLLLGQYDNAFFSILEALSAKTIFRILEKNDLFFSFCQISFSVDSYEDRAVLSLIKNDNNTKHLFYQAYFLSQKITSRNFDANMVTNRYSEYDSLQETHPKALYDCIQYWFTNNLHWHSNRHPSRNTWILGFVVHFFSFCIEKDPAFIAKNLLPNEISETIVSTIKKNDSSKWGIFSIHLLLYALKNNNIMGLKPWRDIILRSSFGEIDHAPIIELLQVFAKVPTNSSEETNLLSECRKCIITKLPCHIFETNIRVLTLPIWDGLEQYRDALLQPENSVLNSLCLDILSLPNQNIHAIEINGSLQSPSITNHNSSKIISQPSTVSEVSYCYVEDTPFPIRIDEISYTKMNVSGNGGVIFLQEDAENLGFSGKSYIVSRREHIVICPWLSSLQDTNVVYWTDSRKKVLVFQWRQYKHDRNSCLHKIGLQFQLQISQKGNICFAYEPISEHFQYANIPNGKCGIHRMGTKPVSISPMSKNVFGDATVHLCEVSKQNFPCFSHNRWTDHFDTLSNHQLYTNAPIQNLLSWIEIPSVLQYLKLYALQPNDLLGCLHARYTKQLATLLEETSESVFPIAKHIFQAMAWDNIEHYPIVKLFLDKLFSEDKQRAEKELREYLKNAPSVAYVHLSRIEHLCDDWTSQEQLRLWFSLLKGTLVDVAVDKIEQLSQDGTFASLYALGHSEDIPQLDTLRAKLQKTLPKALLRISDEMVQQTGQWAPLIRISDITSDMLLGVVQKLAQDLHNLERMFITLLRDTRGDQSSRVCTHLQEIYQYLSPSDRAECYRIWLCAFLHAESEIQSIGETFFDEVYKESTDKSALIHLLAVYLSRKEQYVGMHERIHSKLLSLSPHTNGSFSLRSMWTMLNGSSSLAQELALKYLQQNTPTDISLKKWIDLASHNLLSVRTYAHKMLQKNEISSVKNVSEAIRLLDSPWDETYELGCRILRSLKPLEMSTVIRLCDSKHARVQDFGQELLNEQITEKAPIAEQLAEHPDIHIEHYVAQLISQSAQDNEDIALDALVPYFRRVLSRVNLSRKTRDEVLHILRHFALSSESRARILLPTITWLCCSTVQRDKAHGMETRIYVQETYPNIEME